MKIHIIGLNKFLSRLTAMGEKKCHAKLYIFIPKAGHNALDCIPQLPLQICIFITLYVFG